VTAANESAIAWYPASEGWLSAPLVAQVRVLWQMAAARAAGSSGLKTGRTSAMWVRVVAAMAEFRAS